LRGQTNKFLFPFVFVWSGPKKMNASRPPSTFLFFFIFYSMAHHLERDIKE
jgi:hypothetical protein